MESSDPIQAADRSAVARRKLDAAEELYKQGHIPVAYEILVQELDTALAHDDEDTAAEVGALAAGMAEHLGGEERAGFELLRAVSLDAAAMTDVPRSLAISTGDTRVESQRHIRLIDVQREAALFVALATALVLIGLLLPLTQGTQFGYVAHNRLIEHRDGWLLAVGSLGAFANAFVWGNDYRRTILLIEILAVFAIADAAYIGFTAKVCDATGACLHPSPGPGLFAIGLGGVIALFAVLAARRQTTS